MFLSIAFLEERKCVKKLGTMKNGPKIEMLAFNFVFIKGKKKNVNFSILGPKNAAKRLKIFFKTI